MIKEMILNQSSAIFLWIGCLLVCVANPICTHAQSLGSEPSNRLEYQLQVGQKIGYEVEIFSGPEDDREKSIGFVTYHVKQKNVEQDFSGNDFDSPSTGDQNATSTAFVVSAKGHLITCAHCVADAKSLIVKIDGKDVPAVVVAKNDDLDLAVMKIEKSVKNLPVLKFARKPKVRLAEDVRAVGYPLSEMLGNNVKITRGSIAGFIEDSSKSWLQLDVIVNPGNSGGPLINDQGAVIGVVNAKLAGASVSRIGFAIPLASVFKFLDFNKIPYETVAVGEALNGPDLARQTTPSVFLVEAKIKPQSSSNRDNFLVTAKGMFETTPVDKIAPVSRRMVDGKILLAKNGVPIDSSGDSNLPGMLGDACTMPFEEISRVGPLKQWTSSSMVVTELPRSMTEVTIDSNERPDAYNPLDPHGILRRHGINPGFGLYGGLSGLPGYQRHGIGGAHYGYDRFRNPMLPHSSHFRGGVFGRDPEPPATRTETKIETRIAILERKANYRIVERTGELLTLSSDFSLRSIDDKDEFCSIQMNHKSHLVFDQSRGVFISKKLVGELLLKLGEKSIVVPIKLNYKEVDLKKAYATAGGNSTELKAKPSGAQTKVPRPELSATEIEQFINSATTPLSAEQQVRTIKGLSTWTPTDGHRTQVAARIVEILAADEVMDRTAMILVLLKCDAPSATQFIVKRYRAASAFSRRIWITRLGQTGDPDAAVVLCEALEVSRNRAAAKRALIELGALGEPSLLVALQTANVTPEVAECCFYVLEKIGTAAAIPVVTKLAKGSNDSTANRATECLKRLKLRVQ